MKPTRHTYIYSQQDQTFNQWGLSLSDLRQLEGILLIKVNILLDSQRQGNRFHSSVLQWRFLYEFSLKGIFLFLVLMWKVLNKKSLPIRVGEFQNNKYYRASSS